MIIENLTEMHCHILPGIDDGSKDVQTSLKMIERLAQQGAKKIVLTPHYYSDAVSLDDFLRKRDEAFNALSKALPPGSPELIPAAEVYISDYLFNYKNLDELKIGNSDYILIEHPFESEFLQDDYDRLSNLYCDYGARAILAHIERYKALMDNPGRIEEFLDLGCLTQVNVSSFSDERRVVKKRLFKLLGTNHISIIGSDCHNMSSRAPEYGDGIKAIEKKLGKSAVEKLMQKAAKIVK